MSPLVGIRRETKNKWERRVPLTPEAVARLVREEGISFRVQPSPIRAYPDEDYVRAGAELGEELDDCDVVFAVKEIPRELFREEGTYVFFSHTIKGQSYNMPMLRELVRKRCTLVDYERIVDEQGRRLVFFGYYAGLAGMIDTLYVLGRRLEVLGYDTPFKRVQPTWKYGDLPTAEAAIREVGRALAEQPLPRDIAPLVCGFAGYGNVSRGAQHIWDLLPGEEIQPEQLAELTALRDPPRDRVFKVVFYEKHMVEHRTPGAPFDLQEYYQHPERYRGVFTSYLPHLSILLNGIYWTEAYPRLIPLDWLEKAHATGGMRLLAVGDVSCDIGGAVQATVKSTTPDEPAFTYDPATGQAQDGVEGPGLTIMAVDNLPCELPREASETFSKALLPFVGPLARADFGKPLDELDLPDPIRRAVILHRGRFTPDYRYMERFLEEG